MLKLLNFIFQKWYFLLLTAVSIIGQCYLQLMLPEYMGNITSLIMSDAEDKIAQIWINGGWMMLISVGVIICCISQHYFGAIISSFVGKTLRDRVFKKVNSLSITQFDSFGTATLITRTTNDIEQVKMYVLMSLRVVFMSPTYMIIGLIKTLAADAKLAIILAITIPIILVGVIIMVAVTTPMFRKIQTKTDNLTSVLRGNLTGIRVIRAYNQQEKEVDKFDFANKDLTTAHVKVSRFLSFMNPIVTIVFNLAYIGIFSLGFSIIDGTNLIENGTVVQQTMTNVSVVAQYSSQIMSSFLMLAMIIIMLPQALASSKRINEVLDLEDPINDKDLNKEINDEFKQRKEKGYLKFENVTFTYPGSKIPAISNISFETKPGKTTAIIGSTGSGKSTVVNLIPRLYDVSEGEITLDGFNIKNISIKDLRGSIGFTPQKALLFNGTIRSNIQFGKKEASDEEIESALEIAQAKHFISKLPDGLDSPVAQGGKNFSGGQKQRLTIARSIVKKPEIYVFDDSFNALDFSTDAKLRFALRQNIGNSAMVIVAQRVSSILDADTIVVLNDGQMVGKGTHEELLKSCAVYQDIVKSQLDPEEIEKTIQLMKEATRKEEK